MHEQDSAAGQERLYACVSCSALTHPQGASCGPYALVLCRAAGDDIRLCACVTCAAYSRISKVVRTGTGVPHGKLHVLDSTQLSIW